MSKLSLIARVMARRCSAQFGKKYTPKGCRRGAQFYAKLAGGLRCYNISADRPYDKYMRRIEKRAGV